MRALASSRKREPFFSYSNSPDFHISKKLRFSPMHQTSNETFGSSNSTVSRISRYPETTAKFRREVHAPCRIVKFGLSKPRTCDYIDMDKSSGDEVGNFLSKRLDSARRSAIGAFRYLVKEKEVIDVEKEHTQLPFKEIMVSDDSSIEEVEVIEEDGKEGGSIVLDQRSVDNEVKILEERSVVTSDGNLGVETAGKMLHSLALNHNEVDLLSVEVYKKLLESAEKRSGRLKTLGFEIELSEKKWDSLRSLRPLKKPEEKPVEEIPQEPFVPLTEEEEAEVNNAFSCGNRRKVLVAHKNSNIDITGQVLQSLAPGKWLNDEVINLYLELLKEREKRNPQKFLRCHFFNTFFYKKLISGRSNIFDYKAVRRWTRKLGYFLIDCDKIFVPVHREIHWCLAIINKKDHKFQYLDSLKGQDIKVLENLARYHVEEVKDKNKKDIDVSTWEREFLQDLPEQENGYDCGVFMIKYADFYSRGLGLCFSQEHMPYFRMRTAKEILRLRAD